MTFPADVVRMHSGEGRHDEMDRFALVARDRALEDCGLDGDPALAATLHAYFADGIRRMSEHHESSDSVPAGLRLEQWTGDAHSTPEPGS